MKKYKHIVCPVDFSESSERALEQALGLKEREDAKLTVVNFVEPIIASAYGMGLVEVEGEMLSSAKVSMQEIIEKYQLNKEDTKVERNHAKQAISELAKKVGADLIVVGSHGHNGFLGALLGSTASAAVNRATCDVLVVHE